MLVNVLCARQGARNSVAPAEKQKADAKWKSARTASTATSSGNADVVSDAPTTTTFTSTSLLASVRDDYTAAGDSPTTASEWQHL
jgi:hypothetical protein